MSSLVERIRTRVQDPKMAAAIDASAARATSPFPPATVAKLEAAEATLGFRLPALLGRLYTEVANGGFGPGYGILGLDEGYADPSIFDPRLISQTQGGTLVEWYFTYRGTDEGMPELSFEPDSEGNFTVFVDPEPKPGTWRWFDKLLPLSNHGCWGVSCIDCSKSTFPVFFFDGQQGSLRLESRTFEEWIENWLQSTEKP